MASPTKEKAQIEAVKPWVDLMQAKAFLSGDFLLWLWYFAESPQNPVEIDLARSGKTMIKLWVEDRLVLESHDNKAQVHTFKGGEPSRSLEAEFSLKSGKVVKELRLGLHIDPYGDFISLLSAKDLSPKSIYLPNHTQEGAPAPLGLAFRIQMTDVFLEALDGLFLKFLEVRADKQWREQDLPAIRTWIQARGQAETQLH
ncbi:MAG: hypothetical protein EOP10_31525 [Proteobacteria bacterium]|nr:MAG: hypothetical protein EOP10_31525 [Pseudomonadota bacterium]